MTSREFLAGAFSVLRSLFKFAVFVALPIFVFCVLVKKNIEIATFIIILGCLALVLHAAFMMLADSFKRGVQQYRNAHWREHYRNDNDGP